jgi:hypothetical protein
MRWGTKAVLCNVAWIILVMAGTFFVSLVVGILTGVDATKLFGALAADACVAGTVLIWTIAVAGRNERPVGTQAIMTAEPADAEEVIPVVVPVKPGPLRIPTTVRIAAVIWILHGVLSFLSSSLEAVVPILFVLAGKTFDPPVAPPGKTWCAMFIGIALVGGGVRAFRGLSSDPMLSIVVSGLLGLLYVAMGLIACAVFPQEIPLAGVLGCTSIAFGSVFGILPSSLALAGRSRYLAWRSGRQRAA